GPVVVPVLHWTRDTKELEASFDSLPEWTVPGTQLYEAIVRALYQFQGSQGARALILFTDGYEYEGDTTEEDALAYARESGVKIYALAVPPGLTRRRFSAFEREESANVEVLTRFTGATGGRTFVVRKSEELT